MAHTAPVRPRLWLAIALTAATAVVYAPVRHHDFVNFDDPGYVVENPHVSGGLNLDDVVWAFTATHSANWHPLTWLSHMLDCQLFGLNAGAHHATNVLLHVANTLLLLGVLTGMTRAPWQSAFVAALFALHPLHVESVAWISERKDVLSGVFWFLSLWAYWDWVRYRGAARFTLVLAAFLGGLMAKPMVVTLPFVLLLLDVWPLDRTEPMARLVVEKLPLLMLAAASSVVTFHAQQVAGAVASVASFPIGLRLANALNACVVYLVRTVWPDGLAVFYPFRRTFPAWWLAVAGLLLGGTTFLVLRAWRRRPYLLVGWLWYLGTLAPVLGIVRVGEQSMADRFTYLPLTGIFIMIAWGVPDLLPAWRRRGVALALAAGIAVGLCAALTFRQLGYWHDSITLFRHALDVTADNHVAHTNLGSALVKEGRMDEAAEHFTEALRLRPDYAKAHLNFGTTLEARGDTAGAEAEYAQAARLDPGDATVRYDLGHLFAGEGRLDDAVAAYAEAIRLRPDYARAHNNLGLTLAGQGKVAAAEAHYREALRLEPTLAAAHGNLALALEALGRPEEALAHYAEVVRLLPGDPRGHFNLGAVLAGLGRTDEAITECRALGAIATASAATGDLAGAAEAASKAAELARAAGDTPLAEDLEGQMRSYGAPATHP